MFRRIALSLLAICLLGVGFLSISSSSPMTGEASGLRSGAPLGIHGREALVAGIRRAVAHAGSQLDEAGALELSRAYFPALSGASAEHSPEGSVRLVPRDARALTVVPPRRPDGALVVSTRGLTFHIHRVGAAWPTEKAGGARFDTPRHLLAPAADWSPAGRGWMAQRVDEYAIQAPGAPYVAAYELALPAKVTRVHDAGGYLELCTEDKTPVLRFHRAVARGAEGTTRAGSLEVAGLAPGGWARVQGSLRVRTEVQTDGLTGPVVVDPGWSATSSLATARRLATATLLPSGKVLVAGGYNGQLLASAELYDPSSGTWSATGSLATARDRATATLLPSGKVLVAGGQGSSGELTSAELYDPSSGTWSATGSLATARYQATATLLPSGKVLVAGGERSSVELASAELYDPSSGTWSATGSLATARLLATATLLPSGKVLVAGGHNSSGILASAELYDPSSGTWSATGSLTTARDQATATLLPSGKVLVAGGYDDSSGLLLSTELYDPSSGTWSATGSLATAREQATATLLPSGKVLVAGGYNAGSLASAELYDETEAEDAWRPVVSSTSVVAGRNAVLSGSGFRGVSEASGGGTMGSPTDFPFVTLRAIEGGETLVLPGYDFSATAVTVTVPSTLATGYYLLNVTANAIRGGAVVNVVPDTPPVANDQAVSVVANSAVVVTLTATDPESDPLTFAVVASPTHGTLSGTGPDLTYTPAANYHGPDAFTFKASDGLMDSNVATVSIAVSDTAPVAADQSVSVVANSSVVVTLTATDPESDPLTYAVVASPTHGTRSGTGPDLTYTPAANYHGPDAFTFKASDGLMDSNVATVSIAVSDTAPVAADQSVSVVANSSVVVTLTATDPESDPLTYAVVASPTHGTLSGTGPDLTYTPAANYHGPDAFTFKASDGLVDSNVATVSLAVGDTAPVAADQSVSVVANSSVVVTLTASDAEGDPLTYVVVAAPTHGTLSGIAPNLTYTPAANYHGPDAFTFKANDGSVDSNVATVSIAVSDTAPVAADQSVSVTENLARVVVLTAEDPEGDAVTFALVRQPQHGTVTLDGPRATYTPTRGFVGDDSFTFRASDGIASSEVATVTLHVKQVEVSGGGGCSAAGGQGAGLWALALVALSLLRRRRAQVTRCVKPVAALAAAFLWVSTAVAQTAPPLEVERLVLNPGAEDSLAVPTGRVLAPGGLQLLVLGHFQRRPLVLTGVGGSANVIRNRSGVELSAAYAVTPRLELELRLPVVVSQSGDDVSGFGVAAPNSAGLGTPVLGARFALLREAEHAPLNLAAGLGIGLPIGSSDAYASGATLAGVEGLSVMPSLSVGRTVGPVVVGGQVGALLRGSTHLFDARIGSAVLLNAVAATRGRGLRGELSVRSELSLTGLDPAVELLAGGRLPLPGGLQAFALAGPGLTHSPGTPAFRVLAGLGYSYAPVAAPTPAPAPVPAQASPPPGPVCVQGQPHRPEDCPALDLDGDGVANHLDGCPAEAGDPAHRGCPVHDRDHDGVEDEVDNCPDVSGPKEHQGCQIEQKVEIKGNRIALKELSRLATDRVFFSSAGVELTAEGQELLGGIVTVLENHPEITRLQIQGHTDWTGSEALNLALAQKRAEAVRAYLLSRGIAPERLVAKGFGEAVPLASNDTAEGRRKNRRVEFVILDRSK